MATGMITSWRKQVSRKVIGPSLQWEDPRIEEYAQKLVNVSSSLEESSRGIISTEADWRKLYEQMKKQSENFLNVYPDNDENREIFKNGAESCAKIGVEYTNENLDLPGRQVDLKVQEYLIELNAVLQERKLVEQTGQKCQNSLNKINALKKSKRGDPEKIQRAEQNLEELKESYAITVDEVLCKMKRVYEKRKVMYKAAYIAYWRTQMTFMDMLQSQMNPTVSYVTAEQDKFLNLDVAKLS